MGRPAGCGAPFPPRESTAFVFRVWGAGTRATPYLGPHDFIELIEQHALLLLRSHRFHQWPGARRPPSSLYGCRFHRAGRSHRASGIIGWVMFIAQSGVIDPAILPGASISSSGPISSPAEPPGPVVIIEYSASLPPLTELFRSPCRPPNIAEDIRF